MGEKRSVVSSPFVWTSWGTKKYTWEEQTHKQKQTCRPLPTYLNPEILSVTLLLGGSSLKIHCLKMLFWTPKPQITCRKRQLNTTNFPGSPTGTIEETFFHGAREGTWPWLFSPASLATFQTHLFSNQNTKGMEQTSLKNIKYKTLPYNISNHSIYKFILKKKKAEDTVIQHNSSFLFFIKEP